jgi:hypothetical protein
MPLTAFQAELGRRLAANRSEDSYLAGAAPILAEPRTRRFSHDLDYFHDTPERVVSAYDADRETLLAAGCTVDPELSQPGYIRAVVRRGAEATKVEWAYDSAWRFLPVIRNEVFGYQLHPIDLAINKVLALAGRDEPRDVLDTLHCHAHVLTLGALVWAAPGKDPGFSPLSLLELLRRRGRVRPEDLARLHLADPVDLKELKAEWLAALDGADAFVRTRPPEEAGCLYYATTQGRFVDPDTPGVGPVVPHYGAPGGILPRILETTGDSEDTGDSR